VSRWVMGAAGAVGATKAVGAAGAAEAAPNRTGGWVIAAGMTGLSTSREAQRGQACYRPLHAVFFVLCCRFVPRMRLSGERCAPHLNEFGNYSQSLKNPAP